MPSPSRKQTRARTLQRSSNTAESELHEIKIWGRGGQGIVTAGELLALAAFKEGKYAQAIPSFGAERRGGPSYCSLRIGNEPILLKCNVDSPDVICMFDPTIWHFKNLFEGLDDGGVVLFNTHLTSDRIGSELSSSKYGYTMPGARYTIYTVDATGLALEILGQNIVNTAMMGAFAKATSIVSMDSIKWVIKERVKRKVDENIDLAELAYKAARRLDYDGKI